MDILSRSLYPEIVIAGCGNPLFGDDGFGPAVIEELRKIHIPGNVKPVDAGTGGPDLLFPMLNPKDTKKIIIVDIVDFGMEPGTIINFNLFEFFQEIPGNSIHGEIVQALLPLMKEYEITIIGCQPKTVSYPLMMIELSDDVESAIPLAIKNVMNLIKVDYCSLCCFNNIFNVNNPE